MTRRKEYNSLNSIWRIKNQYLLYTIGNQDRETVLLGTSSHILDVLGIHVL